MQTLSTTMAAFYSLLLTSSCAFVFLHHLYSEWHLDVSPCHYTIVLWPRSVLGLKIRASWGVVCDFFVFFLFLEAIFFYVLVFNPIDPN